MSYLRNNFGWGVLLAVFVAIVFVVLIVPAAEADHTKLEDRYFRGATHTVNGLTAYNASTTQSSTQQSVTKQFDDGSGGSTVYWGIRVYKRASGGTETEITGGTPVAQVSRSSSVAGYQWASYTLPEASLDSTDSVVIRVCIKVGTDSWDCTLASVFTTEQLNAAGVLGSTWTVIYYTQRQAVTIGAPSGKNTKGLFYWGTATYNSRVENFLWTPSGAANLTQARYRLRNDDGVADVDLTAWTQATNWADWLDRDLHETVVYNNKMWVLAGFADPILLRDVWSSSNGVNWTQETSSANWAARRAFPGVVYDSKMWIFGGDSMGSNCNGSGQRRCRDVWHSTDGANWTQATSSAAFGPLLNHRATVFDGKMWVIGGNGPSAANSAVWYSTDGANWTQATSSAGWAPREGHEVAVFDGKMWVIGGHIGGSSPSVRDVWYSTDGVNWTRAPDPPWLPRHFHRVAVYDNKLWVISGRFEFAGAITSLNDVWYSSDGLSWTRAAETGVGSRWTPRGIHTSPVYDSKMWVMGGNDLSGNCNGSGFNTCRDVWYLDPTGATWKAAENATTTPIAKDELIRVRVQASNEGGTSASAAYRLEYATSTNGPWTQVGTSTAHWVMKDSANITDGNASGNNPAVKNPGNHMFAAGELRDMGSQTSSIALLGGKFTENEFAVAATSTASGGATYYFRLSNAGSLLNNYSVYPEVTLETTGLEVPGAPGNPTYSNVSTSTLTVSWTAPGTGGALDYYKLERAPDSSGSPGTFSEIATTTMTSYNDSGLATSTTYWYRVRATNAAGDGSYSGATNVTTDSGGGFQSAGTLISVVIDTQITGGVAPNSIMWRGTQPLGTTVKFQFAASNSTDGPWNYVAWNSGTLACDAGSYYNPGAPETAVEVRAVCHKNQRYIRYKVILETTDSGVTPTVERIILNYAR